jgi:hypothetical protein
MKLNPKLVELLMGWVSNWTDLEPMDKERFSEWRKGVLKNKEAWKDGSWDNGIPRLSENMDYVSDRLKAIGNGQVPQCMALAWATLSKGVIDRSDAAQ